MLYSTGRGRRAADPSTPSAGRRTQPTRRRAAAKSPSLSSWTVKGGLALAAAAVLAGVAFPQTGPADPLEDTERAAAVSEADSAPGNPQVTLSEATSSDGAETSAKSKESEVHPASSGTVKKIPSKSKAAQEKADTAADKEKGPGGSAAGDDGKPEKLKKPLKDPRPTSSFGQRINPITGAAGEFHTGQDFGGACGTPILSSAAGTVVEAGWHAHGGGNRVVIEHGGGLRTTYNHLAAIEVAAGDTVASGANVGAVGSTGASTGCHLHFEVVLDGDEVDPMKWL